MSQAKQLRAALDRLIADGHDPREILTKARERRAALRKEREDLEARQLEVSAALGEFETMIRILASLCGREETLAP